jgi:hypothetical protein
LEGRIFIPLTFSLVQGLHCELEDYIHLQRFMGRRAVACSGGGVVRSRDGVDEIGKTAGNVAVDGTAAYDKPVRT